MCVVCKVCVWVVCIVCGVRDLRQDDAPNALSGNGFRMQCHVVLLVFTVKQKKRWSTRGARVGLKRSPLVEALLAWSGFPEW